MSEVRVYDSNGKLKKTISAEAVTNMLCQPSVAALHSLSWPGENRKCKECGTEFFTALKRQVFCKKSNSADEQCSKINYRRRKLAVNKKPKNCITCGKSFIGTPSRKYCNQPCEHIPRRRKKN
jgi:hypothetical protein